MYCILGRSIWSEHIRRSIKRVAGYNSSVLVVGPSGTGKELISAAIHRHSRRAGAPFIAVDCTSIPASLFSSQLFGHVKGAFSGAEYETLGSFRAADGGTIFLDEIGELSLELQSHLLRVIQQRTVIPVGSHQSIPVDVRVIAATSRQLETEVAEGRFRLDLFYRLNVVKLTAKALRERPEDVAPLSEHFLDLFSIENGLPHKRISPEGMRFLESCAWPGNVRQLQNVLERAVVFTDEDEISERHLINLIEPEETSRLLAGQSSETRNEEFSPPMTLPLISPAVKPGKALCCQCGGGSLPKLQECEYRLICETLEQTNYNQSAAARLLGIDRRLLLRKIRKFGIPLPCSRSRAA
jgi:DNA-binding NtrC family response regulator